MLRHLLSTDLRRFWPLTAAWLVVVAAGTIVEGVEPLLTADVKLLTLVSIAGTLLWMTELILAFLLIALVVQAHPLVGSDAFWMTRPIAPTTLLASKLVLLVAVMVAVPLLARAVLMASYDVPVARIALVAADTTLLRMLILIALMLAAALTRNFSRFAMLCGAVVAAFAVAISVALTILTVRAQRDPAPFLMTGPAAEEQEGAGGFVWLALVPIVGVGALTVQYRTRSRRRAVALGVIGLAGVVAVANASPWPEHRTLHAPAWADSAEMLRLSADPSSVIARDDRQIGGGTWLQPIRARVRLTGIQPGWAPSVTLVTATITLDDSAVITSVRPGYGSYVPIDETDRVPSILATRDALGVERVEEPSQPKAESPIVYVAGQNDLDTVRSGRYRGRFHIALTHYEVEAVLPLRREATHESGAFRIVLDGLERVPDGVTVLAREAQTRSSFDRALPSMHSYYVRNAKRGEAVIGQAIDVHHQASIFSQWFGVTSASSAIGFSARGHAIRFPPPYGMREDSVVIDDAWLADAEFVVLRVTKAGSVQRELTMDTFPLMPPSRRR